jgi:hypothetical protein
MNPPKAVTDDEPPLSAGPVCQLEIVPQRSEDRFQLMQDLLAISHEDDTITLSVKIRRGTSSLEVAVYLRSNTHQAHDTLSECHSKTVGIASKYHAAVKQVS